MEPKVVITVNEGKLRGAKLKSRFSGAEYYSFFGVPYGQSTAGAARFKDPVKVKPWKNILDCSIEKENCCFQFSIARNRLSGSEDCLFNHIHTPQIPGSGDPLKPVIALIHPGGFTHGSVETSYFGSPEFIMHRDIVYVAISHRLHILGYLNLRLEDCAGNQAFKDICLSLQWVQENISAFGGDPNNVTIMGSSSGSCMVHGMMLSPKTTGLFHKAIVMGLHAFNPTLFAEDDHKERAYEAAKDLGYKKVAEKDDKKLLSFFKRLTIGKFVLLRPELYMNRGMLLFPCSPFIVTTDEGENSFLTNRPDRLIPTTRRIPLMFGMCEREAAMGFSRMFEKTAKEHFYKSYKQNQWAWGRNVTDEEEQEIKKKINEFYFKGNSLDMATQEEKIDVQTDIAMSNVYKTLIDVVSSDLPSSVYVYKFLFQGDVLTLKKRVQPLLEDVLPGTFHAEDFSYWAYITGIYGLEVPTIGPQTRNIIEKFTKLITTFARNGNPNYEGLEVEWKPTNPEKPCHLIIDDPLKVVDGKLNGDRMLFWENIIDQYGKN